jgi:plastocyanin
MLGALAAVVPALGADGTVDLTNTVFTPATVTINAGEQVTFRNMQGTHNVTFENGSIMTISDAPAPWEASRQFPQAGTYGYYCSLHGAPGSGMAGSVVVNPAPAGTTQPTGPTTPPPGGTTPPPGDTTPAPGGGPAPAVAPGFGARLVRDHFCTRKSATCKRPGIGIRLTAREALAVTGSLERRPLRKPRGGKYRASGRVRFAAAKGSSKVNVLRRVDGSRIGVGDYRLTLTGVRAAPGSDGTRSAPVVLRFFVRR